MKDIPAFPQQDDASGSEGMTLRDYFAAKAMQGMMNEAISIREIAACSYRMADAMLKAREAK